PRLSCRAQRRALRRDGGVAASLAQRAVLLADARDAAGARTVARHGPPQVFTMSAEIVVRTDGLARRFGTIQAVAGVDLEVRRGEVFGFLGPNGAGKSTTIRMLCTLLRPSAGHASVAGFDVAANPAQVRAHIGLVFQD